MANVPYNYISQPIIATALIQLTNSDSFYFPEVNAHSGFAFNGSYYENGVEVISPPTVASWYAEGSGPYRGVLGSFPAYGLVLLGRANLTILDESSPALALWMTFLLGDNLMLGNNIALGNPNYSSDLIGFLPSKLAYANGIISVIYTPDPGALDIGQSPPISPASHMVVHIDFTQDTAYLDIAT